MHTLHRFPNGAAMQGGHLRWNLTGLFAEVMTGLTALAAQFPEVESIGIDTWAVDYGLLDADGRLLAEPISYRDSRTDSVIERVHDRVTQDQLYAVNGLQYLPFNTLYQLEAEKRSPLWGKAAHVVLLPDLLAYWLTGQLRTEATNASTTGLLDVSTGDWSAALLELLDLPPQLLPEIDQPGEVRGRLLPACEPARPVWLTGSWSPRSGRTTPPRPSSRCPRPAGASATSPAAPGPWPAWSSTSRC